MFGCSGFRQGCHRDVHLRLIEASYEVTDRLIYFLTKQKPDHIGSKQHFYVPEERDCLIKPQSPPGNAIAKLRQVSTDVNNQVNKLIYRFFVPCNNTTMKHELY